MLFYSTVLQYKPNKQREYEVKLVTEKENQIPIDNLTYVGNIIVQIGELKEKFSCYVESISWQSTRYNNKIEKYFIEMYE